MGSSEGETKLNLERLRSLHSELSTDYDLENFSVVESVRRWRQFWKPDVVKSVLLAESHVWTTSQEANIPLSMPINGIPKYPYCRFVYCPAYGENDLLINPVSKNSGTPQFWKLFSACIHSPDNEAHAHPYLKTKNRNLNDRIQAKINLLYEMKRKGIWLVDASPFAIYRPGNQRPTNSAVRSLVTRSWNSFTQPLVASLNAHRCVVIGKGTHELLKDEIRPLFKAVEVISQPQSRLSKESRAEEMNRFHKFISR